MHEHRNAGADSGPRRANMPPSVGNVHGLGRVDALRIDFEPVQLPWLADEIDVLRGCFEDDLAHERSRYDELHDAAKKHGCPDARALERELDRRDFQLRALGMIRDQVPISSEAATAAVANPWDAVGDAAADLDHVDRPLAVAGPAALMTELITGATRNVADALGEALRGSGCDLEQEAKAGDQPDGRGLPHLTPTIAERLRALAAAAQAFTDTYLHVIAQQAYSFDPEYDALYTDELE